MVHIASQLYYSTVSTEIITTYNRTRTTMCSRVQYDPKYSYSISCSHRLGCIQLTHCSSLYSTYALSVSLSPLAERIVKSVSNRQPTTVIHAACYTSYLHSAHSRALTGLRQFTLWSSSVHSLIDLFEVEMFVCRPLDFLAQFHGYFW